MISAIDELETQYPPSAVAIEEPGRFHSNFCPNLKYLDHLSRNHQHPGIDDAGKLFDQFVRHKGYKISLQQCQWLLGIAKRLGMLCVAHCLSCKYIFWK